MPPLDNYPKPYTDAIVGLEGKELKLSLGRKDMHTSDEIKRLLKAK